MHTKISQRVFDHRDIQKKVTRIGNDVWIGRDVLFTPGRTVKDGTVIAARTVVCKDFASYSVIGGNPARLITTRE